MVEGRVTLTPTRALVRATREASGWCSMSGPSPILRQSDPVADLVLRRVRVSAKAGYTTACTEDLTARVAVDIARGASPRAAAQAHGISPDIFRSWMTKGYKASLVAGEEHDPTNPYALFYFSVSQAEAGARVSAEQRLLETYPEKWLPHRVATDAREGPYIEEAAEQTPQQAVALEFSQPEKLEELSRVFAEMHKAMVEEGPHPLQGQIVEADAPDVTTEQHEDEIAVTA
jgi:hypothetical protein